MISKLQSEVCPLGSKAVLSVVEGKKKLKDRVVGLGYLVWRYLFFLINVKMTGCCGYLLPIVSVFIFLFFSSVLSFQPIKLPFPLRKVFAGLDSYFLCRRISAQDWYSTCYIFVVDFCCFTNVLLSGTC